MEILKDLTEEKINELVEDARTLEDAIVKLFTYSIEDWDDVTTVQVGAVTISIPTNHAIIGALAGKFSPKEVMMKWLNYGFSTLIPVADWKVLVDTDKLQYKEKK